VVRFRWHLGIAVVVFVLLAVSARMAEGKKEYLFGMSLNVSGLGPAQVYDMTQMALQLVEKETGTSWTMKKYQTSADAAGAFSNDEIHATIIEPKNIGYILKDKQRFLPWVTFNLGGQGKMRQCFFHLKGDKPKSIQELRGKSLLMPEYYTLSLVELREQLYENGIDSPLWEVFSSFTIIPNSISSFMGVAMGKADLTWSSDEYIIGLKYVNSGVASKLTTSFCTAPVYSRRVIAFNADKVSQGEFKIYQDGMKSLLDSLPEIAKTDPKVKSTLQLLKSVKVELAPAAPDAFAYESALLDKAKKNGWIKEAEHIESIMSVAEPGKPVIIKP
jgi:hypothetical protein